MKRKRDIHPRLAQSLLLVAAIAIGVGAACLTPRPESLATQPAPAPVATVEPAPKAKPLPMAVRRAVSGPDIRPAHQYVKKPDAPKFEETTPGTYEARAEHYTATLSDADGLVYRPRLDARQSGAETPSANTSLRVQLEKIQCGGISVFDRDEADNDEIPVEDASGRISFWRSASLEETYRPRGDGIEQLFTLDERPEGRGDLEIVCSLSTENLCPEPMRTGRAGGIQFFDASGKVAARYGQIVVRDSGPGGHGCVIEPQLSADGMAVSFRVPEGFLKRATFPIVIDPLVGLDFFITDNVPTTITQPALAASTTQFLVAWNDYRAGNNVPQMWADLVSAGGLASPNFPISNPAGVPNDFRFQRTTVASDGSNWLVVWSDDRQVGAGIRGCLIQSTGAILDGDDFLIAPTTGSVFEDPLISYNGSEFIVTWLDAGAGASPSQIYYTRVTPAKIIGLISLVPAAASPASQAALFMAPAGTAGADTLLVYRENNEDPPATRSVRIAADGTLRDPGGTVLFKENIEDSGFGRPIAAAWTGLEWQILSSYGETIDSSVYATRLSTSGTVTPPSGVFAEVGLGAEGIPTESFAPAFAGNGEWLFLRNEKLSSALYHIIGKRVTFNGVDRDPVPFQVDNATQGILRDAVAAPLGNNYLAVWLDGRSGGAQPGDARDVVGAIIDSTAAGSTGTALAVVASASPVSGDPPLVVAFDSTGSTSNYDSLLWDFGDGTTSDSGTVTKTYNNAGTYNAVLRLTKDGYTVSDRVVIHVGTSAGGTGGTQIGTPLVSTDGLQTDIFISTAAIRMNFAAANLDAVRVTGILDQGLVPTDLTGKTATVTVGNFSQSFTLDAKGQFKSANVNFAVDPAGNFGFQAVNQSFADAMAALGLTNDDIKPAVIVNVPVTVTIDTFTATATIGVSYKSVHNDSGVGLYAFLSQGSEVSGSFLIYKFSAAEAVQAKTGVKVHTFSIKGQIVQPNGVKFSPALTGSFAFYIGNFQIILPVGQFQPTRGKVKFVARAGISGLKKFSLDINSGEFNLQMLKVPAEGDGGSGLFVAKSGDGITNVDLNFSMQLSLQNGVFSAGRYIFISRKDLKTKSWKLR